jgi:hypothetical protein
MNIVIVILVVEVVILIVNVIIVILGVTTVEAYQDRDLLICREYP